VLKKKDARLEKLKEGVRVSLLRQMTLNEEQKARVKKIYEQIVHVNFNWGGEGFI